MTNDGAGYTSKELTHFVGRGLPEPVQFELLVRIVRSGWLTYPPHEEGHGARVTIYRQRLPSRNEMFEPFAVSFCDIPPAQLGLHMGKYSRFGLAFSKPFLVAQGATPVFYVAQDSRLWKKRPVFGGASVVELDVREPVPAKMWRIDEAQWERRGRGEVLDEEIARKWDVFYERVALLKDVNLPTHVRDHLVKAQRQDIVWDSLLFSFLKLFEAGRDDSDPAHFYMEREWRVLDNVEFTIADIARVFIPAACVTGFHEQVPEYAGPVIAVEADV